MAIIYRQEILQDITLSASAPKARFYDKLFLNLDLSDFPESIAKTGRNGFSKRNLICSFIVMKCECFSYITDLVDYLNNNRIIAHYYGFDIMKLLPSYWNFDRFIRTLYNLLLQKFMHSQLLELSKMGIIDTSFVTLDILSQINDFISIEECTFLADKGYDAKKIYNNVKNVYHGERVIPLNKRKSKNQKNLNQASYL